MNGLSDYDYDTSEAWKCNFHASDKNRIDP
jgi:hypothetical protein